MTFFRNHFNSFSVAILLFLIASPISGQTIPSSRIVNWQNAGLKDTNTIGFVEIDLSDYDIDTTGTQVVNDLIDSLLEGVIDVPGIIFQFPEGEFLFDRNLVLGSNTILRGKGSEITELVFDQVDGANSISIWGYERKNDSSTVVNDLQKGDSILVVQNSSFFQAGDWVRLTFEDSLLVTSGWAAHYVGQVFQIQSISNDSLFLFSEFRMDYPSSFNSRIHRMEMASNSGIECLKIFRKDDTSPLSRSNIMIRAANNCWVNSVESENCTFAHVDIRQSANIRIGDSYFHHGHDYGDGGRAYGVLVEFASGECLIENNVFEHLRHSMILQAGANGNVFSYNFSTDPFWSSIPNNRAGDMVLHGNYPFANLFEQNIGHNIIVDNSHGPNGPLNTFFRNRALSYGIYFSSFNSPGQNIVGNEITNNSFPYSVVNYVITGADQFIYGNNNKGDIDPDGTDSLPELSYYYENIPSFLNQNSEFGGIGVGSAPLTHSIPAETLFLSGNPTPNSCQISTVNRPLPHSPTPANIGPSPFCNMLYINSIYQVVSIEVFDSFGREISKKSPRKSKLFLNTERWKKGIYLVVLWNRQGQKEVIKVSKSCYY